MEEYLLTEQQIKLIFLQKIIKKIYKYKIKTEEKLFKYHFDVCVKKSC